MADFKLPEYAIEILEVFIAELDDNTMALKIAIVEKDIAIVIACITSMYVQSQISAKELNFDIDKYAGIVYKKLIDEVDDGEG